MLKTLLWSRSTDPVSHSLPVLFLIVAILGCSGSGGYSPFSGPEKVNFSRQGDLVGAVTGVETTNIIIVDLMDGSQIKVRLIGLSGYNPEEMDVPESLLIEKIGEICLDQMVTMRFDRHGPMLDEQKNVWLFVGLEDGTIVNEAILQQGWGMVADSYNFSRYENYRAFEKEARVYNRGMWK